MEVFIDTEFTGLHKNTTLISIGMESIDHRSFYAEIADYDKSQTYPWLIENVVGNLKFNGIRNKGNKNLCRYEVCCDLDELGEHIKIWLNQFDSVEIWAYYLAYDWVLFCDIFGNASNIPGNVFYIPFDICTLFKIKGVVPSEIRGKLSIDIGTAESFCQKHNSLYDAKVAHAYYEYLMSM